MEWDALQCPDCKRVLFFDVSVTDLILCGYGCWSTWPVCFEDPNDEDSYGPEDED